MLPSTELLFTSNSSHNWEFLCSQPFRTSLLHYLFFHLPTISLLFVPPSVPETQHPLSHCAAGEPGLQRPSERRALMEILDSLLLWIGRSCRASMRGTTQAVLLCSAFMHISTALFWTATLTASTIKWKATEWNVIYFQNLYLVLSLIHSSRKNLAQRSHKERKKRHQTGMPNTDGKVISTSQLEGNKTAFWNSSKGKNQAVSTNSRRPFCLFVPWQLNVLCKMTWSRYLRQGRDTKSRLSHSWSVPFWGRWAAVSCILLCVRFKQQHRRDSLAWKTALTLTCTLKSWTTCSAGVNTTLPSSLLINFRVKHYCYQPPGWESWSGRSVN